VPGRVHTPVGHDHCTSGAPTCSEIPNFPYQSDFSGQNVKYVVFHCFCPCNEKQRISHFDQKHHFDMEKLSFLIIGKLLLNLNKTVLMKSKELRKSHIIFHLKGTSISLGR
jgi:hypothetical protein